jgi:Mn2+/Fe2+ NRAMP family transporter
MKKLVMAGIVQGLSTPPLLLLLMLATNDRRLMGDSSEVYPSPDLSLFPVRTRV